MPNFREKRENNLRLMEESLTYIQTKAISLIDLGIPAGQEILDELDLISDLIKENNILEIEQLNNNLKNSKHNIGTALETVLKANKL